MFMRREVQQRVGNFGVIHKRRSGMRFTDHQGTVNDPVIGLVDNLNELIGHNIGRNTS